MIPRLLRVLSKLGTTDTVMLAMLLPIIDRRFKLRPLLNQTAGYESSYCQFYMSWYVARNDQDGDVHAFP